MTDTRAAVNAFLKRLPLPHEHGAWVMLYAPLLIGYCAAGGRSFAPVGLLVGAVTGVFLARNSAALLLRRRARHGDGAWLGAYCLLAAGCAAPLLLHYHLRRLLAIGLLVLLIFAAHTLLLLVPSRKRLDRSLWGEILSVSALVLTGPAAYVVVGGTLNLRAALVWAGCAIYFSGTIFYVKMWLEAARLRSNWSEAQRARLGAPTFAYYALLVVLLAVAEIWLGGRVAAFAAAAFAPAILRAAWGLRKLSPKLPNLKRVGMVETALALWFMPFYVAALRAVG